MNVILGTVGNSFTTSEWLLSWQCQVFWLTFFLANLQHFILDFNCYLIYDGIKRIPDDITREMKFKEQQKAAALKRCKKTSLVQKVIWYGISCDDELAEGTSLGWEWFDYDESKWHPQSRIGRSSGHQDWGELSQSFPKSTNHETWNLFSLSSAQQPHKKAMSVSISDCIKGISHRLNESQDGDQSSGGFYVIGSITYFRDWVKQDGQHTIRSRVAAVLRNGGGFRQYSSTHKKDLIPVPEKMAGKIIICLSAYMTAYQSLGCFEKKDGLLLTQAVVLVSNAGGAVKEAFVSLAIPKGTVIVAASRRLHKSDLMKLGIRRYLYGFRLFSLRLQFSPLWQRFTYIIKLSHA